MYLNQHSFGGGIYPKTSCELNCTSKGYPLKILLKRTRGLLNKEKIIFAISAFGVFRMILFRVL